MKKENMKKIAFSFVAVLFIISMVNCKTVTKAQVGGKDVIHVDMLGVAIVGSGGAPVGACINEVGNEGATRLIEANGSGTDGIPGIIRMIGTVVTEGCTAIGSK